jgi:hypothetical protein
LYWFKLIDEGITNEGLAR